MSSKDDMPAQPKTTELPALTDRALLEDLSRVVRTGLKEVNVRLEDVVNEGIRTNTRLTRIEERVDEVEGRIGRTSHRVREVSSDNLEQDAKHAKLLTELAEERKAREALAKTVSEQPTKEDLKAVTNAQTNAIGNVVGEAMAEAIKTPLFKTIAKTAGGTLIAALMFATAYFGWRTMQFQAEQAAHPPPAATVYVQVPADGGAR